ncbi:MAG TPA: aminotransferase class I/II-fold pyridoxal phosphate-dependent enzyme, partial [Pseudonocardiaceae bacterium]|nr:aminotransferase class I/II-fold pyridoxal phosphate-dependent enzyme [Pseudonocardiaceae bacterium]
MREPALVSRMRPFTSTIFAEMTALAQRTGAVNLGQGFPDTDGPPGMLATARKAISEGVNQYPPGPGQPELRAAVAEHRRRFGIDYDPDREVLITVGATEAISAALLALVGPGDEVLVIEPYYDSYAAAVALAGATRRVVGLREDADGRFALDVAGLRAALTPATRAILINSPHNPTGTVFTAAELAAVAGLCVEHDLIAITDEVYEHLVFDGNEHIPLATMPGMAERTVTVSSAGKTFNCTGWKIGWACGPAELISAVRATKQFLTFVGGAPFQPAVAYALRSEMPWVAELRDSLESKRDRL